MATHQTQGRAHIYKYLCARGPPKNIPRKMYRMGETTDLTCAITCCFLATLKGRRCREAGWEADTLRSALSYRIRRLNPLHQNAHPRCEKQLLGIFILYV